MRVQPNWETSEVAVNVFERFCITHRWPATVVPQQRDFGRDVIVDVAERRGDGDAMLTGELFAAQVKGGRSYRSGDGYSIPVGNHARYWAQSSVPVIGIVVDPDDERCRWVNLTAYLLEHGHVAHVPVASEATLDDHRQVEALLASIRSIGQLEGILRGLGSLDQRDQIAAVHDCFAMGRHDERVLIALRRISFSLAGAAQVSAIVALSHCTPHPDIAWSENNWIEAQVRNAVVGQFRWLPSEITSMLALVDEFGRGSLGQCAYHVLVADPALLEKLREIMLAGRASPPVLANALLISLYQATDPLFELGVLVREAPHLANLPELAHLRDHIRGHGSIDLF